MLWVDKRKEYDSHFTTSAVDADPLRTIIHFLCQCQSLAKCRYRLSGLPTLVNLTELSSIDVKDIASFIQLSDWFSSVGWMCFKMCSLCIDQLHSPGLGGN